MRKVLSKLGLGIFFLLLVSQQVLAEQSSAHAHRLRISSLTQQISVAQQRNTILEKKLTDLQAAQEREFDELTVQTVTKSMEEHAQINLAMARADLVNANQLLLQAEQKMSALKLVISKLEDQLQEARLTVLDHQKPSKAEISALQNKIDLQNSLYALEQQLIETLTKHKRFTQAVVGIHEKWRNRVLSLYLEKENELREKAIVELSERLQEEKNEWLIKLNEYTEKMAALGTDVKRTEHATVELRIRIFEAEEHINLSHMRITFAILKDGIQDVIRGNTKKLTMPELGDALSDIERMSSEVDEIIEKLDKKLSLIKNKLNIQSEILRQSIIDRSLYQKNTNILTSLETDYSAWQETANQLHRSLLEQHAVLQARLKRAVAQRQGLPMNMEAWQFLMKKLLHIPKKSISLFYSLSDQVQEEVRTMPLWGLVSLSVYLLFWVLFWFWGGAFYC